MEGSVTFVTLRFVLLFGVFAFLAWRGKRRLGRAFSEHFVYAHQAFGVLIVVPANVPLVPFTPPIKVLTMILTSTNLRKSHLTKRIAWSHDEFQYKVWA